MKRASQKKGPPKPSTKQRTAQTRAAKDASQIKELMAERTQSRNDAVRYADLIEQLETRQHQLELQNLQLCEAQAELEQSRHHYADLYNLAPVGFMTLSEKGCIKEINHTATEMLGRSLTSLLGKPLIPYLAQADRKVFLKHLWQCGYEQAELSITLRLASQRAGERLVEFTTRPTQSYESKPGWCRTAIVDVTDKRRSAEALSESEAKFRLLADNVGEVFWFMELDPPRVTYVSPAFERIWGVAVTDLYEDHQRWERSIHPDDLPAVHQAFHRWISGEALDYRIEYRVLHHDGTTHWIADRGIVIGHKNGQPHEISGIARDVTERWNAAKKLRGLLEAAPDAMVIVSESGLIETVNAQMLKLFGYTREELVGRVMEMLVPERFRGRHAGHRASYGANPHARLMGADMDLYALRKDGSEFPVEISLSPLETAEGRVVICTVRDITERKCAEAEIVSARQFAESTLEAVPASLAVLNARGLVIGTNQAWHEFARLNGTPDAKIGKGVNYLAICEAAAATGDEQAAHFADGIRDVMSGAISRFSMEYPCHSPTEQRWFVGYVTPFMGNGPHSVVVAHVDISERKRAEQVIRRLNDELESRVEQRTQELHVANEELRAQIVLRQQLEEEILHVSEREQQRIGQDLHDDLGQQLAGIWLMSDVLKSALAEEGSPEAESAEKITGLLKNALALTRSLARGLHPVALQQGGLVAALDELTDRTCDMFKVNCRCKCPPSIDLDNTTATHLYRIAQEAVTNAVKHGQAKDIDIELSTNPHQTVLSVKDQGTGIADLDPHRKGMGLRIMHYRADMIGGTLDVQRSQNGGGTTVVCTIPARPGQTSTRHSHAKK